MFPAALLTTAIRWKQPKRPSTGEEINKTGSIRAAHSPEMKEGTQDRGRHDLGEEDAEPPHTAE